MDIQTEAELLEANALLTLAEEQTSNDAQQNTTWLYFNPNGEEE